MRRFRAAMRTNGNMPPTRLLVALLLVATFSLQAAELVAPAPVVPGPMMFNDYNAESITNGTTTLVAWDNSAPFPGSGRLCIRLLDDPRPCAVIGGGVRPRLATNGRDYLVAFTFSRPRFIVPYDNAGIQLVSSDGTAGPRVVVNRSATGGAGSVAWNGQHWLVGYTSDQNTYVAFFDDSLNRAATIDAGPAISIDAIAGIGGTFWAFQYRTDRIDAVEIRANGTIGVRHSLDVASNAMNVVATNRGALVFLRTATGTNVVTFDPSNGFSAPRTLRDRNVLQDAEPYDGGAAVLTLDLDTRATELTAVDPNGNATAAVMVRPTEPPGAQHLLGQSKDGLLYFESRASEEWWVELYLSRLAGLQISAVEEQFSIGNVAWQQYARIAPNATGAVVFWQQTAVVGAVSGSRVTMFTRQLDALGHPIGPITELPSIPFVSDVVFDGRQYIAVWPNGGRVFAATISADGRTATTPRLLGDGQDVAIAVRNDATFVVWRDSAFEVRGTNLDATGAPVVPGGFPLLPAFGEAGTPPKIAAIAEGFVIVWTASGGPRVLVVSPSGTVRRGYEPLLRQFAVVAFASSRTSALGLTIRDESALFAFGSNGQPGELFEPQWGEQWRPISVTTIGDDRYLVAIVRDAFVYTSEVTMNGAFITDITPLRLLGRAESVTAVNGKPIGVRIDSDGVWAVTTPEPERRRAVRAR